MGRPVPGVLLLLLLVLLGLVSHYYATQFESDYEDRIVSSPTTTEFATTSLRARSSPSFYQGPQCPEHGVRGPPFLVNRRADVPTSSTCERNRSHGFTKPRGCLARRRERPLRVTAASGQTLSQGPHADKVRSPHFFGRWATRFGPPACTGLLFAGFSEVQSAISRRPGSDIRTTTDHHSKNASYSCSRGTPRSLPPPQAALRARPSARRRPAPVAGRPRRRQNEASHRRRGEP